MYPPAQITGYLNVPPVCSNEVGEVATLNGDNLSSRHPTCSSAHDSPTVTNRVHVAVEVGGAELPATPTGNVRFKWRFMLFF